MPKHAQKRDPNQNAARIEDRASQASALLAARARAVKDEGGFEEPDEEAPQPARQESLADFIKRNARYILAVVVVALAVAAGIVALGALRNGAGSLEGAESGSQAYESPYDWTKLDRTDSRYRYVVDGQVKSRLGIDVSENQGEIDWQAVAADGIDYAIVRVGYRGATEGDLYLDGQFWANMDGARNAGLDVGAYFFSQARTVEEAVEEADFVLGYLGGTPLEYPIAFDSEEVPLDSGTSRTTGIGNDEMTAIAGAFCERVEKAGYSSVVYGNVSDLSRYRYDDLESRSVWWAEYGTPVPAANIDIDYWQYSNGGSVAGIPASVDMNIDLTGTLG